MTAEAGSRDLVDLISDCVHCGFCLPACPTYASWGDEADSPRGRIDLMKALHDGALPLNGTVVRHFDACLGCMGCLTACPSGVRYDLMIEATRARVEAEHTRGPLDRAYRALLFALLPYPRRLRRLARLLALWRASGGQRLFRALGLTRLLPRRLAQLEALAPDGDAREGGADPPELHGATGPWRARVGLVAGCVQRVFFPNVNGATLRVLAAEGCDVVVPRQGCCGALSLHAGRLEEARAFARALIAAFEGKRLSAVVVNAAGCGSALKGYGELLADDPQWAARAAEFAAKVRDVHEFLVELGPRAERRPIEARVAYHDPCHLAHAQRIRAEPRALLCGIPGLELVEIPEGDQCCGSAGIYNLVEPASAREIGARKVENVLATGTALVASANPGCSMQMQALLRERGITLALVHPVELLDRSVSARRAPA